MIADERAEDGGVHLRPVERGDLRWLAEVACDPGLTGEHNWGGEPRELAAVLAELEAEFERCGLAGADDGSLIVCLGDGTVAQRLLVDHLFRRDPLLHRVQSDTALDNPAERRSLAKVGMVEEGIVRDAEFRGGQFHDHVLFSVLRSQWEARSGQAPERNMVVEPSADATGTKPSDR